jgi:hypothetical protein
MLCESDLLQLDKQLCDLPDSKQLPFSFLGEYTANQPSAKVNGIIQDITTAVNKVEKKFPRGNTCRALGKFVLNKAGTKSNHKAAEEMETSQSPNSPMKKRNKEVGWLAVAPVDEGGCFFYLQDKIMEEVKGKEMEKVTPNFFYVPYGFMFVVPENRPRGGVIPMGDNVQVMHFVFAGTNSNGLDRRCGLLNPICKREDFPFESHLIMKEATKLQKAYNLEFSDWEVEVKHINVAQGKAPDGSFTIIEELNLRTPWNSFCVPFLPVKLFANAIVSMERFLTAPKNKPLDQVETDEKLMLSYEADTCATMATGQALYYQFDRPNDIPNDPQDPDRPDQIFFHLFQQIWGELSSHTNIQNSNSNNVGPIQLLGMSSRKGLSDHEQPYYIQNRKFLKGREEGDHSFYCYVPMTLNGCNIRVASLKDDVLGSLPEGEALSFDSVPVLFHTNQRGILSAHNFVHVPYGAALILDSREFSGGIEIERNHLVLVCTFSNMDVVPEPEDIVFLRRFLSYRFKPEDEETREKDTSRDGYTKSVNDTLNSMKQIFNPRRLRLKFKESGEAFMDNGGAVACFVQKTEDNWHGVYATSYMAIVSTASNLEIHAKSTNSAILQPPKNADSLCVNLGRKILHYMDYDLFLLRSNHARFEEHSADARSAERKSKKKEHNPPDVDYTEFVKLVMKFGEDDGEGVRTWSPLKTENHSAHPLPVAIKRWLRWASRLLWACVGDFEDKPPQTDGPAAETLMQGLGYPKNTRTRVGFRTCEVSLYRWNKKLQQELASADSAYLFISLGYEEEEVEEVGQQGDQDETTVTEPPKKKQKTDDSDGDDESDSGGRVDGKSKNENDGYIYREDDEVKSLYFLVIKFDY